MHHSNYLGDFIVLNTNLVCISRAIRKAILLLFIIRATAVDGSDRPWIMSTERIWQALTLFVLDPLVDGEPRLWHGIGLNGYIVDVPSV